MSAKHQNDIEHAQKLHGNVDPETSFVSKVISKDKQLAEEQFESYKSFWDERRNGEEEESKLADRQGNYTKLVNAYYNLSTDLYEVVLFAFSCFEMQFLFKLSSSHQKIVWLGNLFPFRSHVQRGTLAAVHRSPSTLFSSPAPTQAWHESPGKPNMQPVLF